VQKATQEPVDDHSATSGRSQRVLKPADLFTHSQEPDSSADTGYHQQILQDQAATAQPDMARGHMLPIPEQHVQGISGLQQVMHGAAVAVPCGPSGVEGQILHQTDPAMASVPATEAHVSPQYTASAPHYTTLIPAHNQPVMTMQAAPQAPGANYAYVASSGPPAGAGTMAPAGQAPSQMYVLVTGSDGGQYLLPVMEAPMA
jgi:hypothetical protein